MAWYNANWGFRKKITIDKDKVDATLTNFPVLISFATDNDIKDEALASGNDILFTSTDGTTKLKHEIQRYATGTGELIAWVKIPSLPHDADTDIYIYYGNAGAADQQDIVNTWDANYKMVQHLKDLTTSTTEDSTSNSNDGTKKGANEPIQASGKIGYAQDFDGTNDYIAINDLDLTSALTLEAWIKMDVWPSGAEVLHEVLTKQAAYYLSTWSDGKIASYLYGLTAPGWHKGNSVLATGTTYHIALVYNGTDVRIYLNGNLDNTPAAATGNITNNAHILRIGHLAGDAGRFFDGLIDEARISDSARTATWISTQYNSHNSPGTFYGLGAEETDGGPVVSVDVQYLPIITADIDTAITNARTGANNKYFNVPIVNDMQIMFIHISQ